MSEQQQLLSKAVNCPAVSLNASSTQHSSSNKPLEIELSHYQSVPTSTAGASGFTLFNLDSLTLQQSTAFLMDFNESIVHQAKRILLQHPTPSKLK